MKFKHRFFLFIISVFLFLSANGIAAENKTISVVGSNSYTPFYYLGNDNLPKGLLVDLWKIWSEKTNTDIEFRVMPFSNCLSAVQNGEADAIAGFFFSRERAEIYDYSEPFSQIPTHIFYRKDLEINNIRDTYAFKIGVVTGDYSDTYLKKNLPSATLEHFTDYEDLICAATAGQVHVFVCDTQVALFHLAKHGHYGEFKYMDTPLYSSKLFIGVRKGNNELLALVNSGLKQISPKEKISIENQWSGFYFPESIPWKMLSFVITGLFIAGIFLAFLNYQLRRKVNHATAILNQKNKEISLSRDALENANRDLNDKVMERTRALEKNNQRLESEVTCRIYFEQNLRDSEKTLSTMMSNLPGIAFRCKKSENSWVHNFFSAGCMELTGYPADYFIDNKTDTFNRHIHPDDWKVVEPTLKTAVAQKEKYYVTYRFKTAGGEYKWFYEQGLGLRDEKGLLLAIDGFISDITDKVMAGENFRKLNEYYQALHELTLGLINKLELDSLFEDILKRAGALTGTIHGFIFITDTKTNDLVLKKASGIFREDLGMRCKPGEGLSGKILLSGEPLLVTDYANWNDRIPDEKYDRFHSLLGIPLKSDNQVTGVIGLAHSEENKSFSEDEQDVLKRFAQLSSIAMENARLYNDLQSELSERKAVELENESIKAQLLHAQKMEAIGTLAGGIAHDFNNLLMAIQGNISLMKLQMSEDEPNFAKTEKVLELIESGAGLTKQLLDFSEKGRSRANRLRSVNLNKRIKENIKMFGRTKKEINIEEDYQKKLWIVQADTGQIDQVLLNLFVNASQAMPDGGRLQVKTENIIVDNLLAKKFRIKPGQFVKITVSDTGTGMDKATMERIFEPFFTTKEIGKGTGLGLASVYNIINSHYGAIDVSSKPGKGTDFCLYLPAAGNDIRKKTITEPDLKKGSGTILIVDDEIDVIDVCREIIRELGYNAIVAKNGREATAIYEKEKSRIDMVILDMIMPDISGEETFEKLQSINPDIKVLLASGYTRNERTEKIIKKGCCGFIQKPFNMNKLSKEVSTVLKN
ncbi:MAG: transporter substrate-binding domain-containing protein [Desulfobacterales bacterium]|nr:transporter substrate-binding domain-containing protein [Desulfobacterales bacterium]